MPKPVEQIDPRFQSPKFRETVKRRLEALGLPTTFQEFKKYDAVWNPSGSPLIDWEAGPAELVVVRLLDGNGFRIGRIGLLNFDRDFDPECMEIVEVW